MTNPRFVGERTSLLALAQGRVLDLCFEPEANLHCYSPWVTAASVLCLDPDRPRGRSEVRTDRGVICQQVFLGGSLELPFADHEFDWAFSILSLCRLQDPLPLLRGLRRVLKPTGTYGFLEHGSSPNPRLRRYQSAANGMLQRLGGCELMRPIDSMIEDAGFWIERIDRFAFPIPRVLAGVYRGVARPLG